MSVIASSAEREAAIEFARAAVIRPATLRRVFQDIAAVPEVNEGLFQILETQRIMASPSRLMLMPAGQQGRLLATLLASETTDLSPLAGRPRDPKHTPPPPPPK